MNRIDQLLQQMIAETSQQVLPTVYSATMLAGLQELQGLTTGIEAQRDFAQQSVPAVPKGWQLVPVESNIDMEDAGRKAASGYVGLGEAGRIFRAMLAAAPAAPVAQDPVAWIEGRPSHPWDKEWFIAELDNGDRVVLRALPEGYAYDLTTADGTYYRAAVVKQWMQFVDSEFVSVAHVNGVDLLAMRELLAAMNRDGGQRQNSVGLAQAAREALAEFHQLQQTLAEQPDTVAVPRELLGEAESIIDSYAEALRASHAPGGDWDGEEAALDDYEREAGVAAKLRRLLAGGAE